MKRGAFEFLQKPFESLDHVVLTVRRALERADLRAQNAELLSKLKSRPTGLIGSSAAMKTIEDMIPDLARSDAAVLIEGESGTGKEVLARAIHAASNRTAKPFVPVNCGAIPDTMLESELFGHEKGAFTGAVAAHRGLFRAADGGTLFLDEIGEIPTAMQVKLLRALQEQEVRAVGSTHTVKVNVRVIAATNRDLKERIAAGAFRDDLYYRLAVVPLRIPPLRDRREDIPLLVRHFVRKQNQAEPGGHAKFEEIDPAAMDRLAGWQWPGNVRELENVIERAFAIGKPGRLGIQHLPEEIARGAAAGRGAVDSGELARIPLSLDAFEKFCLQRALDETGGDASKAAGLLGLPRSTFYRRLQRFGLKTETSRK
jgi:DNA-binding NtrC family response regulator